MFLEGLDALDQKIVSLLIENARMSLFGHRPAGGAYRAWR